MDTCQCCHCPDERPSRRFVRAGGMLLLVVALYLVLRQFGVFSLASSVEGAVGLGTVFLVGLVAATSSCLAVVGGLLLSVSATWSGTHASATRLQKFRPLALFNAGRLGGYFLLGGLAGQVGKSLSLSPYATGVMTVAIALVMIVLGLNILRILPKKYCRLPLPRAMTERIRHLSHSESLGAPLLLGALTFFLPCGFTQSMQLLALGSGSFLAGGLIMLVFALGTLPALLGISVVSSVVEGRPAQWFLHFSGAVVLLLGFLNLQSGLLLTGNDLSQLLPAWSTTDSVARAESEGFVMIDPQGRQIMSMYVTNSGYTPTTFTIRPGLETWVYAIANDVVSGCASFLVDSAHGLQTPIKQGGNWLGPIAKVDLTPQSDFVLTCSMGMMRANVHVM